MVGTRIGLQRGGDGRRRRLKMLGRAACGVLVPVLLALTGCDLPRDPDNTFDSVRGGKMVVGIIEGSRYASLAAGEPQGEEVALARSVAEALDAEPVWIAGPADSLFATMEAGEIDMVIGGIAASTPWSGHAALSTPVGTMVLAGETKDRVFALPLGENRWLLEVNRVVRKPEAEG